MILQKVHWKLTLLCTGITAFIMLVMSLIYLHLSETQLFQNELYSCLLYTSDAADEL